MHILIDVQGLQSASKYRGIGRSTLAMSRAIIKNAGNHRVSILINGMFSLNNIRKTRQVYQDILPFNEIYTFCAHGPVAAYNINNTERNRAACISRDIAIAHINPDIVFITSFFEGHIDEYIVSIPNYSVNWITVCVCHDLIPLLNSKTYLADDNFRRFYTNKLREYERADAIFAISASTVNEIKHYTNIDSSRIFNISSAAESKFHVLSLTLNQKYRFLERYKLPENFIMAMATTEPRKNIAALIEAYSKLPKILIKNFPMLLVCGKINNIELACIRTLCAKYSLNSKQIILNGYLPDNDLVMLYNLCKLFIFPSLHEGFGLPPLEAMSCGAPTISSNTTSLPEIIGWSEAMFDPTSISSIRNCILRALSDMNFYRKLKNHAIVQSSKFSWTYTAKLALAGFKRIITERVSIGNSTKDFTNKSIRHLTKTVKLNNNIDLLGVAWAIAYNSFNEQTPSLWIDITALITQDDQRKIIQAYNLINKISITKPLGYLAHAVCYLHDNGYYYALIKIDNQIATICVQDIPVFFSQHSLLLIIELWSCVSVRQQLEMDALIRAGTQVVFWLSNNFAIEELFSISKQDSFLLETNKLRIMFRYADSILCSSEFTAKGLKNIINKYHNKTTFNETLQIDSLTKNVSYIYVSEIDRLISQLQFIIIGKHKNTK